MTNKNNIGAILALSFLLVACTDTVVNKPFFRKENQKVAASVIQSIEAYQRDNKRLPDDLSVLVPTYLGELPKATNGRNLDYRLDGKDDYTLCFHGGDAGCCYFSYLSSWDCTGQAPEN